MSKLIFVHIGYKVCRAHLIWTYVQIFEVFFLSFSLLSLKTNILENFNFVVLKKDIQRLISSTETLLSVIKGLKYTFLKKVNFFVGHLVSLAFFFKIYMLLYASGFSPFGL